MSFSAKSRYGIYCPKKLAPPHQYSPSRGFIFDTCDSPNAETARAADAIAAMIFISEFIIFITVIF